MQDVAFVFAVQGMQMGVSAALMAWYDWKLFAIMLLLAPAIWVINEQYRRVMATRLRKLQQSWSRLASTLAESVGGIRVTQAFVRHEVNAGFFRKLVNVHGDNNVGVAQASAVFVPLLQMKSQLFLGVMALLGGYGALRWHGWAHMEVGDLVMFFFLANLFFEPVQVLGDRYNQALTARAARNASTGCWTRNRLARRSRRPKAFAARARTERNFNRCISSTCPDGPC